MTNYEMAVKWLKAYGLLAKDGTKINPGNLPYIRGFIEGAQDFAKYLDTKRAYSADPTVHAAKALPIHITEG